MVEQNKQNKHWREMRRMTRQERPCAWCLAERGTPFPPDKSSSICERHARLELRKAHARHAA